MTCDHDVKVQLLVCVLDLQTDRYSISKYTYCNDCAVKLEDKKTLTNQKKIPNLERDGYITKVVCNVKTNGNQYTWFGHKGDWDNYIKHGDTWE